MEKLNANQIKVKVVDFILAHFSPDAIVVLEVQFGDFKRRADVLVIRDTLTAIEIKSPLDSLRKLSDQAKDYNDYFHSTIVVCDSNLLPEVETIVPASFGIYGIEASSQLTSHRVEKPHPVAEHLLITFLVKDELRKLCDEAKLQWSHSDDVGLLRKNLLETISSNEIEKFVIASMRDRYNDRFKKFIERQSKILTEEDLFYLTVSPGESFRLN